MGDGGQVWMVEAGCFPSSWNMLGLLPLAVGAKLHRMGL